MDSLLKPDIGLMFWTIVNFLILALLLAKFAWKPLINALDAREKQIKDDVSRAQQARAAAEQVKTDLQKKLDDIANESAAKIKEAQALGEKQKESILNTAKEQATQLIKQARVQIEADTQKAVDAVKQELVNTTMLAVKKVIGKDADEKTSAEMVEDLLKDIKAK